MDKRKTSSNQSQSDQSGNTGGTKGLSPQSSKFTEGLSASDYTVRPLTLSNQTHLSSDLTSGVLSSGVQEISSAKSAWQGSPIPIDTIKLMPVKVKDVINIFKNNPAYNVQSPVVIKMKENDIDTMLARQQQNMGHTRSFSPQHSLKQTSNMSPNFIERTSLTRDTSNEYRAKKSYRKSDDQVPLSGAGAKGQQAFAMPDVQAFPVLGASGFRANKGHQPRRRSREKIKRSSSRKDRSKSRRKSRSRHRSKIRPMSISRNRSGHRRSRPRKIIVHSRKRSPIIIKRKIQKPIHQSDLPCCTPYPMCDNQCMYPMREPEYTVQKRTIREPEYPQSRPYLGLTKMCLCEPEEKLQFIQPGVCSKKKYFWTNEYAVIPKPQVNLIDPCEELDPCIYPRAKNPCIRDGRGHPLTDCIGRPLRDPVGKRFLKFNPNGSVMDTNLRGNFHSGQPPVCVKCPLPDCSCAPDTTHNWWMSCGHPILPDMSPFFKQVVRNENRQW